MQHVPTNTKIGIRIPVLNETLKKAEKLAAKLGNRRGSIRKGQGNVVGYLLQLAVADLFSGGMEMVDGFHTDIKMPENWQPRLSHLGVFVETKAKERTKRWFEPHWEVSVADTAGLGVKQKCSTYVFGNVFTATKGGRPLFIHILGAMNKEPFFLGYDNQGELQGPELDSRGRQIIRYDTLKTGAEFRVEGLPYDDNGYICHEDCWNRRIDYIEGFSFSDLSVTARCKVQEILNRSRKEGYDVTDRYVLLNKQ